MIKSLDYMRSFTRIFIKKGLPLYLIFFITRRCVCRCKHCFVKWEGESTDELDINEIRMITKRFGRLLFLFLTGGEPFLRDDLPLIAQSFSSNCQVRKMQIPSNGALGDRVVEMAKEIAVSCPETHIGVTISLDALGKMHDEIRGFPGLFDKAVNTLTGLMELERRYPNFNTNVNITISALNQDHLDELYNYLSNELKVKNIIYTITRGRPRNMSALDIDINKALKFNMLVEKDIIENNKGYHRFPFSDLINAKNIYSRYIVFKILRENRYQIPCYAGNLAGVLDDEGNIRPCELRNEIIGNIREADYDFSKIWFSPYADTIRNEIRNKHCFCTHECFLSTNLIYNPNNLLSIFPVWFRMMVEKVFKK